MKSKTLFLSGGVISLVVLLVFLPYLLYAPPWGINGYYIAEGKNKDAYFLFKDGTLSYYSNIGHDNVTTTYELSLVGGKWGGEYRHGEAVSMSCELRDGNMVLHGLDEHKKVLMTIAYRKMVNPFEIYGMWYNQWRNK